MATHHVRKVTIDVAAKDPSTAERLRTQVEAFAHGTAVEIMQRIFDAESTNEEWLRLDKLDIDLGRLPEDDFDAAAGEALVIALRKYMRGYVVAQSPTERMRVRNASEAKREALEIYLCSGALPFWAQGEDYACPALLATLIRQSPAAVTALLRKLPRYGWERLVLQAGAVVRSELLALLACGDETVILAYLADLLTVHRHAPLLPLNDAALERLLWVLTLAYLLREAGSQFNRRRYLERLLRTAADNERVAYGMLLRTLGSALAQTRRHMSLGSSLPAVLQELLAEQPSTAGASQNAPPSGAQGLLARLHRLSGDRAALERYLQTLSPEAFAGLLRGLMPAEVETVLSYLTDLSEVHRAEPLILQSPPQFHVLLRLLTVLFAIRNAGTQFNRRSYLRRLLMGISERGGAGYVRLLRILQRAMAETARRLPLSASLPGVVAELLAEEGLAVSKADSDRPPERRMRPRAGPVAAVDGAAETELLDLWQQAGEIDRTRFLAGVHRMPQGVHGLARAVARLRMPMRQHILKTLAGENTGWIADVIAYLLRLHRQAPLMAGSETNLDFRLWTLTMAYVAGSSERPFDRVAFLKHMLTEMPAFGDGSIHAILSALEQDLAGGASAIGAGTEVSVAFAPVLRDMQPRISMPAPDDGEMARLLNWMTDACAADLPDGLDAIRLCAAALEAGDARFLDALRLAWRNPHLRSRWISVLPEALLSRLASALAPSRARLVLNLSTFLDAAFAECGQDWSPAERWRTVFDSLEKTADLPVSFAGEAVLTALRRQVPVQPPDLFVRAAAWARTAGEAALSALLQQFRASAPVGETVPHADEILPLYVRNAGLVLFAPHLPLLFERLGVLRIMADGRIRVAGTEAASKAVHLLQYLATEQTDAREPDLVLNKLLCGLDARVPVTPRYEASAAELDLCNGLVSAVLTHWAAIATTSAGGLRETFLQREGRLQKTGEGWELTVQRKAVDFLVDEIPWAFHTVQPPWMAVPLSVTW